MPAVTQVVFFSDQDWPGRVLAEEVVRLDVSWRSVEGGEHGQQAAELYLTAEQRKALEEDLARWIALGHRPDTKPEQVLTSVGVARKRNEQLRQWSDELGLRNAKDPVFAAWQTAAGKAYTPVWLETAYRLHEQGQETEAMKMAAPHLPGAQREVA